MTNSEKTHLEQLLKNQFTELDQRFARHVTTISENFDLKIGLIADGQVILRREMHEIRDELKQDIALLDFKIDTVNNHLSKRIDAVASDLKITDTKVDAVAADLKITDTKIDAVAADLKITDAKVDAVAADLKITDAKVDGVATDLKAHRADTEAHNGIYRVKERYQGHGTPPYENRC